MIQFIISHKYIFIKDVFFLSIFKVKFIIVKRREKYAFPRPIQHIKKIYRFVDRKKQIQFKVHLNGNELHGLRKKDMKNYPECHCKDIPDSA